MRWSDRGQEPRGIAAGRRIRYVLALLSCLSFSGCLQEFPASARLDALALLPVVSDEAASSSDSAGTAGGTVDTTAPGFSGITSAVRASSSGVDLSWSAATDETTAQSAIVYDICAATSAGSCAASFVANYSTTGNVSFTASGLNGFTDYYFVIRARDAAGNSDGNSVEMTARTSAIRFYDGGFTTGAFTRTSIDALCTGALPAGCAGAAALLSFSGSDQISNMPATYGFSASVPVRNVGETNGLGANWADILDAVINIELDNANIMPNNAKYWTGSDPNGAVANNCNGWTSNLMGDSGNVGVANRTNGRWLHDSSMSGSPLSCDVSRRFVCVCW